MYLLILATKQELVNQWSFVLTEVASQVSLPQKNPSQLAKNGISGEVADVDNRTLFGITMHSIYIQVQSAKLISAFLHTVHVRVCILYIANPPPKCYNWKSTYLQETYVGYHNNTEYI